MARVDLLLFSGDTADLKKDKSPNALRTISEVAEILDIPQHVLRFWETKFLQLKPLKRNGGRRFYRPQDIDILQQIKHLLYNQGYTIKGAQKAVDEFIKLRATHGVNAKDWLETVPTANSNDNYVEEPDMLAELAQALRDPEPMHSDILFPQAPALRMSAEQRAELLALRAELVLTRNDLQQSLSLPMHG